MKTPIKLLIVAALAAAVAGAVVLKKGHSADDQNSDPKTEGAATAVTAVAPPGAKSGIPRLVDVGRASAFLAS